MSVVNKIKSLKKISQNLTILYVEDDQFIRESTEQIFQKLFRNVDTAIDGEDGLYKYHEHLLNKKEHYDIVITDINMPKIDGILMSKEILKLNKNQTIIVISAHDEKDYVNDMVDMGIEGFLSKPLNLEATLDVLHNICIGFHVDDLQYFSALREASIISKTNADGIITYVNENFCKLTGYPKEELIGRTHNIIRHDSNDDILYAQMWKVISSGNIWRGRMINRNKDGSDFIAETTIIPLIDENGIIIEYIGIRNDITDLVKIKEKSLKEEGNKLRERKVKEAQKAFLVIFTHELKTPLNAIINFSKYIRKQMDSAKEIDREKISSLLDSVLRNSKDMLENITQILEISKLNSGKLSYSTSTFSINDSVSGVLSRYSSLFKEKGIKVSLIANENYLIHSDSYRVEQIVANIVSNAIKYGDNEIIITIVKDKQTMLSIEDNGEGIKDKESIFNLFSQENSDLLERKAKGTGIGLYFMNLLCKDLNINHRVEDRNGVPGTKFTLEFK